MPSELFKKLLPPTFHFSLVTRYGFAGQWHELFNGFILLEEKEAFISHAHITGQWNSFSSHIPACKETGVRAQARPQHGAPWAEKVKGITLTRGKGITLTRCLEKNLAVVWRILPDVWRSLPGVWRRRSCRHVWHNKLPLARTDRSLTVYNKRLTFLPRI